MNIFTSNLSLLHFSGEGVKDRGMDPLKIFLSPVIRKLQLFAIIIGDNTNE